MFNIDPSTGLIFLYGIYPLFSIRSVVFCVVCAMTGGLMVFLDNTRGCLIKGFLLRALVASLLGFISYGVLKDHFNIEPKEYVAAIIGFLSYPIFRWLFANLDDIAEGVLGKVFSKAGIELKKKNKEENSDD